MNTAAIWHDLECGGYAADLELWAEQAAAAPGPVLDLGCGTGRVALHLARLGFEVEGLDPDPDLLAALSERAGSLPASAVLGDAREFDIEQRFGLAIAPMQLLQLFAGAGERVRCMRCVRRHLLDGGRLGLAIVEAVPAPTSDAPPIPDAREVDGWIYSSLPLDTMFEDGEIAVRRLRQTVSPAGELREATDEVRLQSCSAEDVEAEGKAAGLRPAGRLTLPPTEDHVGSTVVILEASS